LVTPGLMSQTKSKEIHVEKMLEFEGKTPRPRVYSLLTRIEELRQMEVDDSFFVPCDREVGVLNLKKVAKKLDYKFTTKRVVKKDILGYRVWRIK
jgi:hypothetical protein